jgi:hypothetical protein
MVNGKDLVLNQKSKTIQGKWFKPERLKFYISDLTIVVAGRSFLLSEVLLADATKPASLSQSFPNFDDVEITSFEFGLGLKPSLNNPTKSESYDLGQFSNDNPLSSAAGMYWGMTSDYRFFLFEGRSDISADQDSPDNLYKPFQFHIGKDKFYRKIVLAEKSYTLKKNQNNTFDLFLDLNKMFTNGTDSIDLGIDFYTEANTPEQEILAGRLSDNLQNAFSIKPKD